MEPGLSPLVGSTRKSQTVWLMSEAERISTRAYSPMVERFAGGDAEPVLAGKDFGFGGDDVFVLGDGAVGLTWTAPTMRTALRSSTRTMAKPDWAECAPCLGCCRGHGAGRCLTVMAPESMGGVVVRGGEREIDSRIVDVEMDAWSARLRARGWRSGRPWD